MTTRHPCPLCGAPLTYDGTHDGVEAWQCTADAAHVHVAGDCCDAATDAERGQDATQEPQDATEAAERRVERYARVIHDRRCERAHESTFAMVHAHLADAHAVIAVADQEQAELREQRAEWLRTARDWSDRAETAEARVAELEATVAKVRALHAGHLHDPAGTGEWSGSCLGCGETWPCQTAAILGPDQP